MPINSLDIIIVIPILIFFFSGIRNGFIEEAVGLIGQILAIFLSFTYVNEFSQFWESYYDVESAWIPFFSFIALYILIILIVKVLIKLMESVIKMVNLSTINHVFGGLFSAAKGALIVSAFLVLISVFGQPTQKYTTDSVLYTYVLPVAPKMYDVLSIVYPGASKFKEQVGEYFEHLNVLLLLHDDPESLSS
jgi:membrane protein required for colicin V production